MTDRVLDPEKWVENHGDYLYRMAVIRLDDVDLAKDLVSDTFLSALLALESFRYESNEKTWLTSILKNKIIDYYRKKKPGFSNLSSYLDETEAAFFQGFFEPSSFSAYHWKSETAPTKDASFTEQVIQNSEFNSIVQYCLDKIPSKMRPIFIARFMDDEDSEIICKEFNISPSNYWILIHRAKLIMRSCLEKNWLQ